MTEKSKQETRKNKKKTKPPKIPVRPAPGYIIVRPIDIISRKEKEMKEKGLLPASKENLHKMLIKAMQEDGPEKVYDEHPDQAEIMAIRDEDAERYDLQPGDRIAYYDMSNAHTRIIFNKKMYIALRTTAFVFEYLSEKR